MSRRLLMIYEKFPPLQASGTARVFHFAKTLAELGWQPSVLSMPALVGDRVDAAPLSQLPDSVHVERVTPWLGPAKDWLAHRLNRRRQPPAAPGPSPRTAHPGARRVFRPHSFSWRVTGLPLWLLDWHLDWAAPALLRVASEPQLRNVDVVWVSAPPMRHLWLADTLSRLLAKPLVIDLRDPWTYGSLWQPRGQCVAHWERAHAKRVLTRAARVVTTSPLTQRELQQRFPEARVVTISNGFTSFQSPVSANASPPAEYLFRYIGSLNERRTPDALLAGFALAIRSGKLPRLRLEFVGPMGGHEGKIAAHGLSDFVTCRGPVGHDESVRLMRDSNVNVLLQTISQGQDVIAGKTFEYLAARKPILAVVPSAGGDAWLLREVGGAVVADDDSPPSICAAIEHCVGQVNAGTGHADPTRLAAFERGALGRQLSDLLDDVVTAAHAGQS